MKETLVQEYSVDKEVFFFLDSLLKARFELDGRMFLDILKDEYPEGLPEGKTLNVKMTISTGLV